MKLRLGLLAVPGAAEGESQNLTWPDLYQLWSLLLGKDVGKCEFSEPPCSCLLAGGGVA